MQHTKHCEITPIFPPNPKLYICVLQLSYEEENILPLPLL